MSEEQKVGENFMRKPGSRCCTAKNTFCPQSAPGGTKPRRPGFGSFWLWFRVWASRKGSKTCSQIRKPRSRTGARQTERHSHSLRSNQLIFPKTELRIVAVRSYNCVTVCSGNYQSEMTTGNRDKWNRIRFVFQMRHHCRLQTIRPTHSRSRWKRQNQWTWEKDLEVDRQDSSQKSEGSKEESW